MDDRHSTEGSPGDLDAITQTPPSDEPLNGSAPDSAPADDFFPSCGLLVYDVHGTVVDADPASAAMLGWPREAMAREGRRLPDLSTVREDGSPFPPDETPSRVAARTGLPVAGTTMGILWANRRHWLLVSALPRVVADSPGPCEVIVSYVDITARVEAEAQARRTGEIRERQIGELERARRREIEAKRQTEALLEATRQIGETLALAPAMEAIVNGTRKLFGADRAAIFYQEPDQELDQEPEANALLCFASFGFSDRYLRGARARYASTAGGRLPYRTGCPETWCDHPGADRGADPRAKALLEDGARAFLAVPLTRGPDVVGVLEIAHEYPRRYDPDEIRAAVALAHQAAIAIEHAFLYEDAESRARELATVNDATKHLVGAVDASTTLQSILDSALRLSRSDLAGIALLDPTRSFFRFEATRGEGADLLACQTLPMTEGLAFRAAQGSAPIIFGETDSEGFFAALDQLGAPIYRSGIWIPLSVEGTVIGILGVFSQGPRRFNRRNQRVLVGLADHAALAIHRVRAEAALRDLNARLEDALTRLRSSQQQIIQQERLRALGEMASGIAHDFNNALQHVIGFCDLLLEVRPADLDNPTIVRNYLDWMRTAANDAAETVRRLRAFYRVQDDGDAAASIDLNAVASKTVSLTQPRWRDQALARGAEIIVRAELGEIPPIRGKEAELREALTNLIFNAVDALPNGGTVVLRTRQEGGCVALEVADSGVGMTEDVRRRCLEPFFSTKGQDGTGLGLAMVYGTIQRHGGDIEIQSAVGEGTTVRMRLPVQRQSVTASAGAGVSAGSVDLDILLVDDEPGLREIVAELLRGDGHRVRTVASGAEALDLLDRERFNLVITDRAMPGMSGDLLAAAVKRRVPTLPVLMLTGFGELMHVRDEMPSGVNHLLSKPVTRDNLRRGIAAVLETSR